jgi:membrane fusion protein, multidrug efflux system
LKKIFLITALCFVAGAPLAWLTLTPAGKSTKTTETATKGTPRAREGTAVRTLVVQPQPIEETIIATGTIRAEESIEVQPEMSGMVQHIHFTEGSRVRAGDLLVGINDAELRASLQRAVYRRELAELKTRRITALIDKGGVPQQDYDIAASELSVLSAEVELIKAQLARTVIRAPFDGIIGLRSVSEGAYVTPATRIARLQAVDTVKLDLTLSEKYGDRVRVGQTVQFSVAGQPVSGTAEIYALEPQIDETTRTILVRARAANPGGTFRPGAFARVAWRATDFPAALMVPSVAVISASGEKTVFVAGPETAERRVVVTGLRTAGQVQILAGLKAGERVIVSGLQSLRAGAAIKRLDSAP